MQVLAKIALAAKPFTVAFDEQRILHEPELNHPERLSMQKFMDSNEVTPIGTVTGDWRKLANLSKVIKS